MLVPVLELVLVLVLLVVLVRALVVALLLLLKMELVRVPRLMPVQRRVWESGWSRRCSSGVVVLLPPEAGGWCRWGRSVVGCRRGYRAETRGGDQRQ